MEETRVKPGAARRPRGTLRALLKSRDRALVTPAAHDALSARLIQNAGFEAISIAGSAMIAARYALPDLGIVGLGEMVAGIRDIIDAVDLPCTADGDDGYGGVKNVVQTVLRYEAIGVSAVTFEDQSGDAKQPGQLGPRLVVSDDEIGQKLRAAVETRSSMEMMIVGRTDLFKLAGRDAAMRRADMYLSRGVDGVFVAGLDEPEDYRAVGERFRGTYLPAVLSPSAAKHGLNPDDFFAMGFARVIFPAAMLSRAIDGMTIALEEMQTVAGIEHDATRLTICAATRLPLWQEVEQTYVAASRDIHERGH